MTTEEMKEIFEKDPEKAMLMAIWCGSSDSAATGYWNTQYRNLPIYQKNFMLDLIYEFLQALGYEMSTVEKALQDGTHELFPEKKEGEEPVGYEEDEDEEE